jgi:hypothetical protein
MVGAMLEYAHMSSMSSISISISDADLEPGQKMQLVVSISPPRGWHRKTAKNWSTSEADQAQAVRPTLKSAPSPPSKVVETARHSKLGGDRITIPAFYLGRCSFAAGFP